VLICFLPGQWQAGSRKQKGESLQDQGLAVDENQWGRNFVERWMAVRPWENRLHDSNAKEGVPISDGKQVEDDKAKALNKPKKQVAVSTVQSNGSLQKEGTRDKSHSDASGSSPGKSKMKAKPSDEIPDEVSSQPSNLPSRSTSNPKERPEQIKSATKKRLSLLNNSKSSVSVFCYHLISRIHRQKTSSPHHESLLLGKCLAGLAWDGTKRLCYFCCYLNISFEVDMHLGKMSAVHFPKAIDRCHLCAATANGGAGKGPINSGRTNQTMRSKNAAKGPSKSESRGQPKPGNTAVKPEA
jgi:hypothetical protein